MRPDRIIVGECRGGEALDMLQAMNTGHDGSMTTVHANSAEEVIKRLEVLVLMAVDLPVRVDPPADRLGDRPDRADHAHAGRQARGDADFRSRRLSIPNRNELVIHDIFNFRNGAALQPDRLPADVHRLADAEGAAEAGVPLRLTASLRLSTVEGSSEDC